jgi:hypothetical protein
VSLAAVIGGFLEKSLKGHWHLAGTAPLLGNKGRDPGCTREIHFQHQHQQRVRTEQGRREERTIFQRVKVNQPVGAGLGENPL